MAKKAANSKTTKPTAKRELPQFEEMLEELEKTVIELEDGKLGLAAALEKYENGVRCLKECYEILQNAEQKVEILSRIEEDGTVRVKNFDSTSED